MMNFLDTRDKRKQFYFSYGIFMINGMLALSIGSLLPFIREARGLEYAFAGFIVSLHSVGNLLSGFLAGALPLVLGKKRSILLFELSFALAYILILVGREPGWLAVAFFLTGLARGATSNFCNTAINNLAPGKAWTINALHAMFSVGAFLFPILLTLVTMHNGDNWLLACGIMALMGLVCWLLYFLMPMDDMERKQGENRGRPGEKESRDGAGMGFLREPLFYLCILTLFFYLCAEQGVIGWLVTYFGDTGLLSASVSQLMASVLWVMILAGRLTTAALSTRVRKEKLLPLMGLGIVAFFLLLIQSTSPVWIVVGIMGFGFSMAGIYPTTVSFAGNILKIYPISWSFILTAASLGSILMPSIIGRIADARGIGVGMASVAVAVLIELICIIVLVAFVKKIEKGDMAG